MLEKKGDYPFPNAYVILLSPRSITAQQASKLQDGEGFELLGDIKELDCDREVIKEYIYLNKKHL
ncbi:MAG: hypothetical protein HeimC3_47470 [Candidatus Heimdallarchaeota archaeon LC_3]|nr:MAG: hypothetical protein HeimC3_47470 [Candidatus Heimdallarchaeota archaeon LC_3]